jgi:hypothetical protein
LLRPYGAARRGERGCHSVALDYRRCGASRHPVPKPGAPRATHIWSSARCW